MAYTIKGLAKANECESLDAKGLADLWHYWFVCNSNDERSISDFKSLRKVDRQQMLNYLKSEPFFCELDTHICKHIYD